MFAGGGCFGFGLDIVCVSFEPTPLKDLNNGFNYCNCLSTYNYPIVITSLVYPSGRSAFASPLSLLSVIDMIFTGFSVFRTASPVSPLKGREFIRC